MTRGIMIGIIVVLAGVAGTFIALYIEGRKSARLDVLRSMAPPQAGAPVVVNPITEVQVSIPAPQVPSP